MTATQVHADAKPPPLVLASSSRYRRELLTRLRLEFSVVVAPVDETPRRGEPAARLAQRLARSKAHAARAAGASGLIIGSDQTAALGDRLLGKPGGFEAALAQLDAAAGRELTFYTAACLLNSVSGRERCALVPTAVSMRRLGRDRLQRYLRLEQPYDCAGSFKAEGLGIALFDTLRSDDPTALIGLPLIALCTLLEQEGVTAF